MRLNIYHNPRCRKSREVLKYLEDKGVSLNIIKYLEESFNKNTLVELLEKIEKKPSEILRKNEVLWKKEYAAKNLSEDQILQLLVDQPKLIERPIVVSDNDGVLARPIENLIEYLKKH